MQKRDKLIMKKLLLILSLVLFSFGANAKSYDTKYAICYGQMTKAHKARGFHQNNRSMSIKVKEEICTLYAKGKIDNYEGKR